MDGKEEARILQLLDDTLSSDDSSNNSEQDNDKDSIYMPASNSSDSDSDEVENVYDELVSDLHSLQPISTSSYCQSEVVQEEVGTSISTTGIDFPNKVVGLLDDMSTGFTNTDIDSQSEVVIDEVGVSIATNGIDTQSEVVLEEMIIITDSIDYQSEVVVEEVGNVIFDIQANPSNMLTDNECEVVEETISLELTTAANNLQFSRVPFARVKHLVIKKVSPLLIEFRESFKDDLKSVTLMEKKIIRTSREATSSSLEKEYMEQLLPVVRRQEGTKVFEEKLKLSIRVVDVKEYQKWSRQTMGDSGTSDKFLDDARRGEMHRYKQLAIALESKSYRQMDTRSCSIDSGVVAPSNIVSSCTSSTNSPENIAPLNRPGITKITADSALNDHLDESSSNTFNHEETLVFRDLQELTVDQISNVPQEWSSNKGENFRDARILNQNENLSCLNVTLTDISSVTSENNLLWCKGSNSPQRNYPEGHISTDTSPQGNETVSQEQLAFNNLSIPNENTQSFINLTSSGNQTLELRMASNLVGSDKVLDISDLTCCPHSARVQENSQPLDETSSSIALTASTDLNQYLHTPVNTSGGSSPSTAHLETPPDSDGLWACRAVNPLPLSVESFKLQQKSLCSGVGLEVLSDETYKKSLLTVQYLNEQVTSPEREPRITDSSSEEYESSCCDVTYEGHEAVQNHVTVEDSTKLSHSWVNCQVPATIHTDVSTATSEMGTAKDKATLMVEENVGNQIRLATNGYEEISGKSVCSLESIVTRDCVTSYESSSPPRLVRSNSYTLESPSPILLAHLEQMKILSASRDSIMQLQVAGSATPKRRKGWHIPSTSLNIVPFSGTQDISVTVPSNALFALPRGEPKLARKVTTRSKGTLTNQQSPYRKSSSLPSTVSSSPVKLNTSFVSVDLLKCEASKTVKISSSSKRDTFQKSTKNISSSVIAKTTTSKNTTPKSSRLNHTSKERSNVSSPSLSTNCVNTVEDENDSKIYNKLPIYLLECNARSELAKDDCTDTERQPCKLPEQDVRQMLEAVEAKYKKEMAQLLEQQRYQQEKVMMEHKRMLDKLQHQGMPLVAMPESTRLLDLAILQTTQVISLISPPFSRLSHLSLPLLRPCCSSLLLRPCRSSPPEATSHVLPPEVSTFPRNDSPQCEMETPTESMVLNRSGCNRQLFSSMDKTSNTITNNNIDASYNSTNNDAATFNETANNIDILQRAASVLTAGARGFLVRRLMKTERIQSLIETMKDTVKCAIELQAECNNSQTITQADVDLHHRLQLQLDAAILEFHDVFFTLSVCERMNIISTDREKLTRRLLRTNSVRAPLSAATQRSLQRKLSHGPHSASSYLPPCRSSNNRNYVKAWVQGEKRTRTNSLCSASVSARECRMREMARHSFPQSMHPSHIRRSAMTFFSRTQASPNAIVRGIGDYDPPALVHRRIRDGVVGPPAGHG
uniref:Centriolar coiled-coil protein of 110 kDa n=1 Tax=Timema monikensis TaxID=170555 RepID=A0A7R9E7Y1_9NEOP|nr:unnamed protein product [Timema monikensis]